MNEHTSSHAGRDPHDVLGVPQGADRVEVLRAFQRKVKRGGHPDTGGDAQTFDEIIRARDVLLAGQTAGRPGRYAHRTAGPPRAGSRPGPPGGQHPPKAGSPTARPAPTSTPRPRPSEPDPPRETSKLAIGTVVLALLGPFFWPVAIVVGHVALRQMKRTGHGGGAIVPVVLFFLYILTLPVLARVLTVLLIP